MKKNIYKPLLCILFFCALSTIVFSQNTISEKAKGSIRVMSYNIRNAKGMDNITNYKRIADVITKLSPDVVALQEIDSVTNRSKQIDVLKQVAEHCKMYNEYSASINYDGGKYGIGILSKEKPLSSKRVALPGREEARSLLIVEFKKYVLFCSHFSLNKEDRLASVDIINSEAAKYNKPILLAGDINDEPESPVIEKFKESWDILSNANQFTFPANKAKETIDYIMGYKPINFTTLQTEVIDEPIASDHLPIFADIKIK